ncbi:hypothetical protein PAECIP111892_02966 [Paenibacillus auburnensis]|jgi:Flp pilus assembly pilin Flp|uniref:Flagellin Flp1-like domain-containing protein n=1 Tax=Paenibacillus auburnensis TaxID=2905649 RepID=A0ABM9CAR8_9BACL|nr:hypothetical protein [Paenibacillus auburnensis]CAH1207689.1 hypothetical protein PAECIP111892_02966 [Paenibacillus auburnensis]
MNRWLKMNEQSGKEVISAKPVAVTRIRRMLEDERGAVGVKEIAVTVGVIVIIGAVVSLITGTFLNTWISDIWTLFIGQIKEMTTS